MAHAQNMCPCQSRDYMGGDEIAPGSHGMDFPCSVTEGGQVHCPSGN